MTQPTDERCAMLANQGRMTAARDTRNARTPGPDAFAGNTAARKANDCCLTETVSAFERFYGTKDIQAVQTPATAVALAVADYRSHQFPIWEFVTQLRRAEEICNAHDELVAALANLCDAIEAQNCQGAFGRDYTEAHAALAKVRP